MRHPRHLPRPRLRERGSVLVVCMVLAALGTIGVAAWFSLLDARSQQVEASLKAVERRVSVRNGRALAQRAIYTNFLHANTGVANDVTYTLPSGKGRAILRANPAVPLRNDTAGLHAQDGVTPLNSASVSLVVDVMNGSGDTRWTYRLRNQHPALGGDLLSLHTPAAPADTAPLVSGNLRVKGRAVLWDAIVRDFTSGLRADEYLLPNGIAGTTTFSNLAGTTVLPLNYPHYQRTTGVSGTGPAYRGELELISGTTNPQNAYESRLGATPTTVSGTIASSKAGGPPTKAANADDPTLLAYIAANDPASITSTLSARNDLSSAVLLAALAKNSPSLSKAQYYQIFNAQISLPDDALSGLMAKIDTTDLGTALDQNLIAMNEKFGARYNSTGKSFTQVFISRPEITRVVITNSSRVRLVGQSTAAAMTAAAALPPLLILIDHRVGGSLARLDILHENRRPLIIAAVGSPAAVSLPSVNFQGTSAFPVWRGIFDLQNVGLAFDISAVAGVRLIGGIRGNHRITVTGGNVTLERDLDGNVLAPLLSRDAWIETVRN
ncbi:MAG: hypothetical protein JNJ70_01750 [Verrucomicrobiales bacterium]|nr:hypothetical protein [Verrucomicrobiales bacterium]